MSSNSTYRAANIVAPTIEKYFADQHEKYPFTKQELAPLPTTEIIEAILDATFWASLRREEGHSPKISLALLPPEQSQHPLLFEHRLPLNSRTLTKLSPGVERPGIHLGIWYEKEKLYIWGTTMTVPGLAFVLNVPEPGLLVIKHSRVDGFGKFANVAVLTGDQVKVIDENYVKVPDCPSLLTSILSFNLSSPESDSINILLQLAVSMRSHKRGGTLVVVPSNSIKWKESVVRPIHYSVVPPFGGLAEVVKQNSINPNQADYKSNLRREVENLAGLSAIDGAIIINERYELMAFGAKLARPDGKAVVEKVFFTEPVIGVAPITANLTQIGGTRHLSAAQFVQDQPDCVVLVASQDGRFTFFSWSSCESIVQAHRIDSLLL